MNARALVVITLIAVAQASAQNPEPGVVERPRSLTQYSYQQWDDRDGLPQNSVQAIATSKKGYLWLGTQLGIARYDGVRFKVFDADNTPALKKAYVWALDVQLDSIFFRDTTSFDGSLSDKIRQPDLAAMNGEAHGGERRDQRHHQQHQREEYEAKKCAHLQCDSSAAGALSGVSTFWATAAEGKPGG